MDHALANRRIKSVLKRQSQLKHPIPTNIKLLLHRTISQTKRVIIVINSGQQGGLLLKKMTFTLNQIVLRYNLENERDKGI